MAAPNIVNVATITGKSVTGALGTSTATLLQNSASSNKVFKIKVDKCISNKTWVKFSGEETFYIRDGNSSRKLTPEEADDYWIERENI